MNVKQYKQQTCHASKSVDCLVSTYHALRGINCCTPNRQRTSHHVMIQACLGSLTLTLATRSCSTCQGPVKNCLTTGPLSGQPRAKPWPNGSPPTAHHAIPNLDRRRDPCCRRTAKATLDSAETSERRTVSEATDLTIEDDHGTLDPPPRTGFARSRRDGRSWQSLPIHIDS